MGETIKRRAVIRLVRQKIGDGTLKSGAPVFAAALARESGVSALTARRALRLLLDDGTLTQGVSRSACLRVAAVGASGEAAWALRAELSRALSGLRRARGLTQPELAAKLGVSVTTIGHAETGRTWQRAGFWHEADELLGGGGILVRLHDRYPVGAGSRTRSRGWQRARPRTATPFPGLGKPSAQRRGSHRGCRAAAAGRRG
jgi:hypothetical protein